MSCYEENIKRFSKKNLLKCKCGGCRYEIVVYPDDNENRTWINVKCKKCGTTLFYNGA